MTSLGSGAASLLSPRSVDGAGGGGDGALSLGHRPPSPAPDNWVWVMGNGGLCATVPDHLALEVRAVECGGGEFRL